MTKEFDVDILLSDSSMEDVLRGHMERKRLRGRDD